MSSVSNWMVSSIARPGGTCRERYDSSSSSLSSWMGELICSGRGGGEQNTFYFLTAHRQCLCSTMGKGDLHCSDKKIGRSTWFLFNAYTVLVQHLYTYMHSFIYIMMSILPYPVDPAVDVCQSSNEDVDVSDNPIVIRDKLSHVHHKGFTSHSRCIQERRDAIN